MTWIDPDPNWVRITHNLPVNKVRPLSPSSLILFAGHGRIDEPNPYLYPFHLNKIRWCGKSLPMYVHTVDSAYNIHGYKGQPVIVATKIMSQNPH